MKDQSPQLSINELKELDYANQPITPQQRLAIKNFDRYRFRVLTNIHSEDKFHKEFHKLQVQSNLTHYEEFLKEEYC